ncbi:hypothetical protein FQN54_005701 [Arachnomyces sp. PD_36]|nr:hypothetical protein FQN54_005701 [Arachnomyces sp. PD_36]
MKSFAIALTALFALTAQAAPTRRDNSAPQQAEHPVQHVDTKDAAPTVCNITGDGVRYRTCPSTDDETCPALGQFPIGEQVAFSCWTTQVGRTDIYWDRTVDNEYIIEQYVDPVCASTLPKC